MTTRILRTLGDELRAWRVTITKLRDEQGVDADDLIRDIDATIKSIARLQAQAALERVAR